jgi:hypothetical protein
MAGDGANEDQNVNSDNVATPQQQQQQRRGGIRMAYVVTMARAAGYRGAADVHGGRRAGDIDVTADLAAIIDRRLNPHRGRRSNRWYASSPYHESEGEEEH